MNIVEQAKLMRSKLDSIIVEFDDSRALDNIELFPLWETNINTIPKQRVQYKGTLYECVQGHTTQDDWTPDVTPALWKEVSIDEYPQWVQPAGAQDAYSAGAKVTFDNNKYISITDNNVWQPGVYGWEKIEI